MTGEKMQASPGFARWCLVYSVSFLVALVAHHALTMLGLLVGITISPAHPFIFLLAFLAANYYLARKHIETLKVTEYLVVSYLLLALLIAGGLSIARSFYDFGPDSYTAHAPGAAHLTRGWNPVWDPVFRRADSETGNDYPLKPVTGFGYMNYPASAGKLSYFLTAGIASATGNIEDGKLINWLIMSSLLMFAYGVLRETGISRSVSLMAAMAVTAHPVILYQSKTIYVDAYLAAFLSIFILSAFHLFRANHPLVRLAAGSSLLLILSTKLSGLFFAVFLAGVTWATLYFYHRKTLPIRKELAVILGLASLLSLQPYVTNIVTFNNPTYPVKLNDRKIFIGGLSDWFQKAGRLDGFVVSLFSKTDRNPDTPEIKLPFTVSKNEIYAFHGPDVRIGGFGPLFSGALVLSLAMLLWYLIRRQQFRKDDAILIGAILGSSLIPQITWWARFTPHVWLIPVLLFLAVMPNTNKKGIRYLGIATIVVMLANSLVIASFDHLFQSRMNRKYHEQLAALKQLESPVRVYFSNFHLGRIRLTDNEIKYVEAKECENSPDRMPLVLSENIVCLPAGSGVQKNWP